MVAMVAAVAVLAQTKTLVVLIMQDQVVAQLSHQSKAERLLTALQ
jgi:hypothetical protein